MVETRHASSLQNNIVLVFEGEEETEAKILSILIKQAKQGFGGNINDVFFTCWIWEWKRVTSRKYSME